MNVGTLSPSKKRRLENLRFGRGDMRWRGKLPIPSHTHPLVKQLFQEANEQQTTLTEIADRASIRRGTISNWRYRAMPSVVLLDAALNVLGFELHIRKRKERTDATP